MIEESTTGAKEEVTRGECTRCGKLLFGGPIPQNIPSKDICMCMREKHDCQFILISNPFIQGKYWARVGCPICGQVRSISEDGKILIVNKAWQTTKT